MNKLNNILVVGDLILDTYLIGDSDRISPEAPIPIVLVDKEKVVLGGAANVASNLSSLGIQSSLFGALGDDLYATKFIDLLKHNNIENYSFLDSIQTTLKTRVVSRNQQIVRIDKENQFLNSSKSIELFDKLIKQNSFNYLIVSDYGKGLCCPDFMNNLMDRAKNLNIDVLIDPKGSNWKKYSNAFLVKPNLNELSEILGYSIENKDSEVESAAKKVIETFDIKNLLVTRSDKGMTLVNRTQSIHLESKAKQVYDISGAGDTVIASLCYGLSQLKLDLEESMIFANKAASIVIGKFGTSTITLEELQSI